jgi:flagellar biosynthesis protein FlhA
MDGYTVVDGAAVIATHLTEVIRANGFELLGRQEVQNLLDNLAKTYPKAVDDLIPTQVSLSVIVRILRNLLRERVSIRDLRTILEAVGDCSAQTKDPDALTEYARQNLSRSITSQYADGDGFVHVISLDPMLDRRLAEGMRVGSGSEGIGMPPSFVSNFLSSVRKAIEQVVIKGYQPVLLCSQTIRAQVYRLVAPGVHTLAVLSPDEIDSKVNIQAIEVVRMPDEA